ncbi:MAG: hypothetical protein U9R72_11530 [Chloroflexota bacterium]|nr:hypothetical protein [Chloroflexota bacterium]
MPLDLISVREATETYGYSGSHIRNLLGKGMIEGEKIAGVWLVDPNSLEEHQARMERLGSKKHGTWAKAADKKRPSASSGSRDETAPGRS